MLQSVTNFNKLSHMVKEQDDNYADDLFGFDDTKDVQETTPEGIIELNYTELAENIVTNYSTEPKQSAIIYGPPGVGKSMVVKSSAMKIAKSRGLEFKDFSKLDEQSATEIINHPENYFVFIDLRTAEMEPTDAQGIPDIKSQVKYLRFNIPLWAYLCTRPGANGILFFDELNQGNPQVLMALFKTFNNDERLVGQHKLGEGYAVFGAGNLGSLYGTDTIPVALTSRADVWSVKPDFKNWLGWAKSAGVHPYILSFISSNPKDLFYQLPKPGQSSGFPSPRSFVNLSAAMKNIIRKEQAAKTSGESSPVNVWKTIEQYSMSKCGSEWGSKFMMYLRTTRLLDFKQIAQKGLGNNKEKLDEIFTVIQFIVEQVNKEFSEAIPADVAPAKKEQIEKARVDFVKDYIKIFNYFDKEYQIQLFTKLNEEYKDTHNKLYNIVIGKGRTDPEIAAHVTMLKSTPEIGSMLKTLRA